MRKALAILLSISLCLFLFTSYAPAPKRATAADSAALRTGIIAPDSNPMQSISYVKFFPDGNYQRLNEDELLCEAEAYTAGIRRLIRIEKGEVGYMKITLTAERTERPESCPDEKSEFFILSALAEWIVKPSWATETTLTLSWTRGAVYDSTYTDLISLSEHFSCEKCSRSTENFYSESESENGRTYNCEKARKHLAINYSPDIVGRFKPSMTHRTCIHELLGIGVQERTAFSLRARVCSREWDFNACVSISNRISTKTFKIPPALSIFLTFDARSEPSTFFTEPITVTYLAKP